MIALYISFMSFLAAHGIELFIIALALSTTVMMMISALPGREKGTSDKDERTLHIRSEDT